MIGVHHYNGSNAVLTDALVTRLSKEFATRGAEVRSDGEKKLLVTVNSS